MKMQSVAALLFAAAFLAGSRLPALAACQPPPNTPGVFFVTDRQPLSDDQLFSGERGLTSTRTAIVSRGVVSSPASKRTERRCSTEASFFGAIAKKFDNKRGQQILIYIHGYYTTFKAAATTALTMQQSLRFPGPTIVYSWPSKVTSRLAYINDETNAGWSMVHFRNFLAALRSKYPKAVISFTAHSLGARFAAEGIAYMRHTGCANCLGRIALFAPDVDTDTLRSELAAAKLCSGPPRAKPKDSARVTLYVSNKDLALRQSQQVHGHQRAGQGGTEMLLCGGVDTIDVSYLKSSDKAGHSYQVDPAVLMDARQAFAGVSPTASARKLKRVTRSGVIYYELKL